MSGANAPKTLRLPSMTLPFAAMLVGALALCGLTWTAPTVAYAAEQVTEPIVIDKNTPAEGASGPGWEWEWAGSAGTLTLDGADISIPDTYAGESDAAIVVPAGSTIHLIGENSIVMGAGPASTDDAYAVIECDGDLLITGDASSSASIRAEAAGSAGQGICAMGDLSIGVVELNVIAETASSDVWGSTGVYVGGNLVINNAATVAVTGSEYGLHVAGSANITDARQVKFGTENASVEGNSALVEGEAMISDVEDVVITGSAFESMGQMTIAASNLTAHIGDSDWALYAHQGIEITDGSFIEASSPSNVIETNGHMLIQDSDVRAESIGEESTAIFVSGDLTIADSNVTALGDEAAADTLGIFVRAASGSDYAGTLTLEGEPYVVAEGSQAGILFVSSAEDWDGNHVALSPAIGVIEGGMLTYAERSLPSPKGNTEKSNDVMSLWTYATDKVTIDDYYRVNGASQRVVIGAEHTVLFVTDNGDPATGLESIKAIAADGTEYAAEEWLDGSHVGYYRFPRDLPVGAYELEFDPDYETADSATISVSEAGSQVFTFNFCTVEMKQADNVWAWLVQPSTGERVSVLEHMLIGAELELGAQPDKGYAFVKYSATGTAPAWENGDSNVADQTVAVEGATVIEPAVKADDAAPIPDAGDEGKDPNSGTTPDAGTPSSDDKVSALPTTGDALGGTVVPVAALTLLATIVAVTAICMRMRHAR